MLTVPPTVQAGTVPFVGPERSETQRDLGYRLGGEGSGHTPHTLCEDLPS